MYSSAVQGSAGVEIAVCVLEFRQEIDGGVNAQESRQARPARTDAHQHQCSRAARAAGLHRGANHGENSLLTRIGRVSSELDATVLQN